MVQVVPGFSLTNRWLLYTSLMLTPAQYMSGLGSNSPINIGFLAYNWYTQYMWYIAAKEKSLQALSLLPVHFNFIYAFTYLGGVSSGNIVMGLILGIGTAGLIILNTITAWTSWATNLPEGYGIYQFFFFGWRTLTPGWHTFFCLWQVGDTFLAISSAIYAIVLSIGAMDINEDDDIPWYGRYLAIIYGPPAVLVFTWELIMWVELIVSRNDIESETDMVAVWLFVAQVVLVLMPDPWLIALTLVSILWRIASALMSALGLTLWWIASTLKRIPVAMSNWRTQSTTSNVSPKPSEASEVIKLEEGAQQNSSVTPKPGPEAPGATQLQEGAQQNSNVAPTHSLEAPGVTRLEGTQQNSSVLPTHSSPEAPAVIQSEEAQQNQPGSN